MNMHESKKDIGLKREIKSTLYMHDPIHHTYKKVQNGENGRILNIENSENILRGLEKLKGGET